MTNSVGPCTPKVEHLEQVPWSRVFPRLVREIHWALEHRRKESQEHPVWRGVMANCVDPIGPETGKAFRFDMSVASRSRPDSVQLGPKSPTSGGSLAAIV